MIAKLFWKLKMMNKECYLCNKKGASIITSEGLYVHRNCLRVLKKVHYACDISYSDLAKVEAWKISGR